VAWEISVSQAFFMDRAKVKKNVYRNCRNCARAFIVEFHLTKPGKYACYKCPGCKAENWVEINPDPRILTGGELQEVKKEMDQLRRDAQREAEAASRN